MALAPRAVDLKHNLGVNNGTYGLLLSFGAVGSITSLLVMGRLVNHYGIRRTLYVSATVLYGLMAITPHLHVPIIYTVVNIGMALSASAHMIALHTQILQRQDESGEVLLARMQGAWSIGVLGTVTAALLLTTRVSFAWHIDILMCAVWVLTCLTVHSTRSTLSSKSNQPIELEKLNFGRIRKIFTSDKSIMFAFSLGTFIEFASGDWSTLVTNQEIGAGKSASVLSFFALIVAMILGRLYFVKLIGFRSEQFWIRLASLVGGGGFIVFSQLAKILADKKIALALPCEIFAFLFAGFGTSFMSALFTTIANRRSAAKPSEVVAQLSLSNTVIVFVSKTVVAWIAQVSSISTALLIPGIALLAVSRFAHLGNPNRLKS